MRHHPDQAYADRAVDDGEGDLDTAPIMMPFQPFEAEPFAQTKKSLFHRCDFDCFCRGWRQLIARLRNHGVALLGSCP